MLHTGITSTPQTATHLKSHRARYKYYRPRPLSGLAPHSSRGLAIIVDDGDPTLGLTGYRLYVEHDRYLIRVWHRLTNAQVARAYIASLAGEPLALLLAAFGLRHWGDLPATFSGFWGDGDETVRPEAIEQIIREGRLLPLN